MAKKLLGWYDVANIIVTLLGLLLFDLPIHVLSHPFRRVDDKRLLLKDQIFLFTIRRTNYLLTPAALRYVTNIGLPESVLDSRRYKPYSHALFQEFVHPDATFRGRRVIQGSFTQPSVPAESDIVILYLHGGGYFSSSTDCYLLFLLRLAETIVRGGKTVSIFALEYDLAPEHVFPTQLRQAGAAYRWLVRPGSEGGVGVQPGRLLLGGDSAGGHLSLSLLVDLQQPYASAELDRRTAVNGTKHSIKPGLGLFMISPWLSLWHEATSFPKNECTDVLSRKFLLKVAGWFLGPERLKEWPPRSPYLEFLDPKPMIDWQGVLPAWVWVSAGKNEILYDDVKDWLETRKKDCRNGHVEEEIDLNESHVYAWLKTTEPGPKKEFLRRMYNNEEGENISEDDYKAIERIGKAILRRYKNVYGGSS